MYRMRTELIERMFGGSEKPRGGSDLLVVVDVFGDYLQCLDTGFGPEGVPVTDPMQDDAGVMVYPHRLQFLCERMQEADRVAVIDMSDHGAYREPALEFLPDARLLAREARGDEVGAWSPYPFLYNVAMLWLEYVQPQSCWLLSQRSSPRWDWAFCGTLAHERYGQKRKAAVQVLASRYPHLTGGVLAKVPFHEVLGALQSVRFGLDLPGVGELCFRLHECLAVGTPVWRPFRRRVELPTGLRDVVAAEPDDLVVTDRDEVRSIYAEHYAPMAAARHLLAAMEPRTDQYSISRATNMAAAASR